jgi:DNA gyrase subunit A
MIAATLQEVNIVDEMRTAYLDYAMSVIVSRALPDARDGLKPVQRRILYAMREIGVLPTSSHKKSARIVGEVLGKYHPHGDQAVYDAMVRMAQDFSMRTLLVDGQGNFGSIDGDNAAAMRYTEARMAHAGADMMTDIEKDTVEWVDNFDGSLQEPVVLPAGLPNLLVNGCTGIAVGMSTSIPPHNLGEVCDALTFMLQKWEKMDDIGVPDLMQRIKGPDFPTGAMIALSNEDENELVQAYSTGRGKITVRATAHVEEMARGRSRLVITSIPYATNKTALIERIVALVRDGKLDGPTDVRDESDRHGLRVVIEIKRGIDSAKVLEQLYKFTPLQNTFSIIMLALVGGEPRLLSLKQTLRVYIEHRLEIIQRRSEYDLACAKERAHILEGLLIALDNIDEIIDTIRRSRTTDTARTNLMKRFSLSEAQAEAVLSMQLRRLASLERKKVEDELAEKRQLIEYLEALLVDPAKQRAVIVEELAAIKAAYNSPRLTAICEAGKSADDLTNGSFAPTTDDPIWIAVLPNGKLVCKKRGKGKPPVKPAPGYLLPAAKNERLYVFTKDGQAATVPVHQLNGSLTASVQVSIAQVVSLVSLSGEGHLVLVAEDGKIKRVVTDDLPEGINPKPFCVMNVRGSKLVWAGYQPDEDQEIMLATAKGKVIRFALSEVRATGLPAGGIQGVKVGQGDRVVSARILPVATKDLFVWSIDSTGAAKLSPLDQYPVQSRAGQGVIGQRMSKGVHLVGVAIGARKDLIVVDDKVFKLGDAVQKDRATPGEGLVDGSVTQITRTSG